MNKKLVILVLIIEKSKVKIITSLDSDDNLTIPSLRLRKENKEIENPKKEYNILTELKK